jgi:lantibiotic modifying enzyme
MSWKAILSGADADIATSAISEIAKALSGDFESDWYPLDAGLEERSILRLTLAHGLAGWAVFFAYLHLAHGRVSDRQRAVDLIVRTVDSANEITMNPSLLEGITGIAWAVEHLKRIGVNVDDVEIDGEVDDYVLSVLDTSVPEYPEVAGGAAGIGIYALERFPCGRSAEILLNVITVIRRMAVQRGDVAWWYVGSKMVAARNRQKAPDGYWDLGMAHGNAGIALFLVSVLERIPDRSLEELVRSSIRFLEAQELAPEAQSRFPSVVLPGLDAQEPSRLGWCYGDLAIATLFVRAGRLLSDQRLFERGLSLAFDCAAREPRRFGVVDECLCHGAAGIGHILRRLTADDNRLGAFSRRWLRLATLAQTRDIGIAGYQFSYDAVDFDGSIPHTWSKNPGLLLGPAGVGLALLAAVSEVAPQWDALFLLS